MLFGKKSAEQVDELRLSLARQSARASFYQAQFDEKLFSNLVENELSDEFKHSLRHFQKLISKAVFNGTWSVEEELVLIEQYLLLAQMRLGIAKVDFNVRRITEKTFSIQIRPLSILPLLQNAVHTGFNSPVLRPIKCAIQISEQHMLVDVSNQVNPYIVDQNGTWLMECYRSALEHYYPKRSRLFTNSNTNRFKASLQLDL